MYNKRFHFFISDILPRTFRIVSMRSSKVEQTRIVGMIMVQIISEK